MRIGVIPAIFGTDGGIYQYSLSVLDALQHPTVSSRHEIVVYAPELAAAAMPPSVEDRWHTRKVPAGRIEPVLSAASKLLGQGSLRSAYVAAKLRFPLFDVRAHVVKRFEKELSRDGIDIMFYPFPTSMALDIDLPFIMAVHDIAHRLLSSLPEFQPPVARERESLFARAMRRAQLILVDSQTGRDLLLRFYGDCIEPHRVKVVPFVSPPYLRSGSQELQRVGTPDRVPAEYFFYPAQFWPHKNHEAIVRALAWLCDECGVEAHLVLCGSYDEPVRKVTFSGLKRLAAELGVSSQVHYLGYVPDAHLAALYRGARGLVMPTLLGPTNLPIVEAWTLGCPVITSDIAGVREHASGAALLVDPHSPPAIGDAMLRLMRDPQLRAELVRAGQTRVAAYGPSHFATKVAEIVREAEALLAAAS